MGNAAQIRLAVCLGMNSVYFLVPGLRVPENVWDEAIQGADFLALATLFEGAEPVLEQRLVQTPVLAGATHLLWLWEVLSKTKSMPEMAAFEWEADGGPAMGTETWRLWSVHLKETPAGLLTEAPQEELTSTERDQLHDDILAAARRHGFQLQQWADRWYLTRKDDWAINVRPWCAQNHRVYSENAIEGEKTERFHALINDFRSVLQSHPVNVARRSLGQETVDTFWPDGGSRRHLLKTSTLRAVMSDHSYVWGWAQNAGLLNFRTVPVADHWPEAPEGDLVVELDDLYESYRTGEWNQWREKLPALFERMAALAQEAKKRRCSRLVLVATGEVDSHTVIAQSETGAKGFLSKFKKKKPLDVQPLLKETVSGASQ